MLRLRHSQTKFGGCSIESVAAFRSLEALRQCSHTSARGSQVWPFLSPKGMDKSAQTSEVVCQGFFEKKSTRCPQFFSQPSHLLPGRLGRKLLDGRPQGRVATLQRFQVLLFVIGNPVLPTTKQDTDPFVSHHPNGGPVAVAAGS